MKKTLAALTILTITVGSPVAAHVQQKSDPNDTQGKLDIKTLKVSDEGQGQDASITFLLKTYGEWSKSDASPPKGNIAFTVDRTNGTYRIEINKHPDGKLRAAVIKCNNQGCDYQDAELFGAQKPFPKVVKTTIPRSSFTSIGDKLKWRAETAFGTGCDGNCFFDMAPSDGYFSHQL